MRSIQICIEDLAADNFTIAKGPAKAILPEERNAPYYTWLEDGKDYREYDIALRQRIQTPFEHGLLIVRNKDGSIRFDDRKLRYSYHDKKDEKYTLFVAPTHFGEMQRIDIQAQKDPAFFDQLIQKGQKDYEDPAAYFSSCFAVNAVPVTNDGCIHIFKRKKTAEVYPEYWHVIGGVLDINPIELFETPKPTDYLLKQISKVMKKEFIEETGTSDVSLTLTGLVHRISGTADFTHVAHIPLTSKEFLDTISNAKDAEHSDIAIFRSCQEINDFLKKEGNVVPVGRGSLQLYLARTNRY